MPQPPAGRGWLARWWRWSLALVVLLALAVFGYVILHRGEASAPRYRTAEVSRGNLVVRVTATGNLQPTNQVDVGSELSGTMEAVFVDVNDKVRRGQILAQLDMSRLQDQLANARGALAAAQAQVKLAAATVKETRLQYDRLSRLFTSSGGQHPARADVDAAEASLQRAQASHANALAAVLQAQAALSSAQTNLAKASIRSPINGVVLTRTIEPGQTVAASLQAPVLFSLAEDLSKMELQVDVDEADVGLVRDGQRATFTVDAYPAREYPARVRRVGFGSQTKDGVVSYLTVLTVDNVDMSLRPGMTATASIVVSDQQNVLLVPSAALRFTPEASTTPAARTSGNLVSRLIPHRPSPTAARPPTEAAGARRVWILRDGRPVAVPVTIGASDGKMSEVTGGDLKAGMKVIIASLGASP
ncbi:efflux RND transporter periplasmic adaptor subunit [Rhodanobacter ginsengisoli]|uniref:Efflux RND transporter periplasmic adaptor subunit n=1 Tax=Rhodanobacter ginsengisoli TaxID=418646 RepID=A0ABW0QP41_9GAMM